MSWLATLVVLTVGGVVGGLIILGVLVLVCRDDTRQAVRVRELGEQTPPYDRTNSAHNYGPTQYDRHGRVKGI